MKLTVFFDERSQFWTGIVETGEEDRLKACRHVFGSEPKEADILAFVRCQMMELIARTTQSVQTKGKPEQRRNPKRMARLAAREVLQRGVSTFAQEALKAELEGRKQRRVERSK